MLFVKTHFMDSYINTIGDSQWQQLGDPLPASSNEKLIERWLASDRSVNPFNPKTWDWINAGLQWVLKKVMAGAGAALQSPFVMGFSLADKIAWLLRKGIDATKVAGNWVLRLMRKIMQALRIAVVNTVKELTHAFMRRVLEQLMQKD